MEDRGRFVLPIAVVRNNRLGGERLVHRPPLRIDQVYILRAVSSGDRYDDSLEYPIDVDEQRTAALLGLGALGSRTDKDSTTYLDLDPLQVRRAPAGPLAASR